MSLSVCYMYVLVVVVVVIKLTLLPQWPLRALISSRERYSFIPDLTTRMSLKPFEKRTLQSIQLVPMVRKVVGILMKPLGILPYGEENIGLQAIFSWGM